MANDFSATGRMQDQFLECFYNIDINERISICYGNNWYLLIVLSKAKNSGAGQSLFPLH